MNSDISHVSRLVQVAAHLAGAGEGREVEVVQVKHFHETAVVGGVLDLLCVGNQLMISTGYGVLHRMSWEGTFVASLAITLKQIGFANDLLPDSRGKTTFVSDSNNDKTMQLIQTRNQCPDVGWINTRPCCNGAERFQGVIKKNFVILSLPPQVNHLVVRQSLPGRLFTVHFSMDFQWCSLMGVLVF